MKRLQIGAFLFIAWLACMGALAACESSDTSPGANVAEKAAQGANSALSETGDSPRTHAVTRYRITVIPPSMEKAPMRLKSLLERLGIALAEPIAVNADIPLAVPQATYLEFIDALQKHGRLRVTRETLQSEAPPSAPIPFVIRFAEEFGDEK